MALVSRFGLLLFTSLVVAAIDAPLASSLPSIASSAYPYYQTLEHFTFDNGANPDAQGWTTHDLTAQYGTFWHVDDFAGLFPFYMPVQGSKSMWCGARQGTLIDPFIKYAPGYGDGWTQILQSVPIATTPDDFFAYLSCTLRRDLAAWDYVDVEYRIASGPWELLERLHPLFPVTSVFYQWAPPVAETPSTIEFRFVMVSDFNASDESESDTRGAVLLDNVRVQDWDGNDLLPMEQFESYAVGSTSTTNWSASVPVAFGNYAGLVPGSGVVQSGTPNTTHVWSFFNGSSETYACGGHAGQAAVPKTANPGSNRPTDYLWNEVRSPWIDLAIDQSSQPVDPNMGAVAFEFDVYADLPNASNRVMYTYRYRFTVGGVVQEWHMSQQYRSSNVAQWVHEDVFSLGAVSIPAGATHVQVGLVALDFAYASGATGMCHSQSPLFDNVTVHRMYEPLIVTNDDDSGAGSVRDAIANANADPDFNAMLFDLPAGGPQTIALLSPLPPITQPVWIDGFSQTGALPNQSQGAVFNASLKVALRDDGAGGDADGLYFAPGGYGVVRGLAIGGFSGAGIRYESTSLIVTGCYIGTDATGTAAAPNGIGILAVTTGMDIGGPFNEERMLISSNSPGEGIRVVAGDCHIFNCRIGYDAYGFELANGDGIHVLGGSCQIGQPTVNPCDGEYTDRVWITAGNIVVHPAASGVTISQVRFDGGYIDLGNDGTTPNDPLDADTGANGLLNFPVLTSADGTTILGNMDGLPNQTHHIEFFSGDGFYGVSRYLGYQNITTDGAGQATISFSCGPIPAASLITATATAGLSTSELGAWITSMNTPPGDPFVNLYDDQNTLRASAEFDNVASAGNTWLSPASPPAPAGWNVGSTPQYWDITTNASYTGGVHVFLHYNPGDIPGPENMLRLLHLDAGTWVDITDAVDVAGNRIGGTTNSLSPFVIAAPGATGVGDQPVPAEFALHANIPNPFNPVTTIGYDVPAGGADVTIAVYDVSGRRVRTLVSQRREAGRYTARWNGEDDRGARAASGVYFYRMNAGGFVETRKMVLLK